MPTAILMPALSPTMEEGKLAKWLVKEGQMIKAGDVIAEIETDKATMEVEASDEGKLGEILIAEGTEGVKVNTPIATLLGEGEGAPPARAPRAAESPPEAPPKAPPKSPPKSPPKVATGGREATPAGPGAAPGIAAGAAVDGGGGAGPRSAGAPASGSLIPTSKSAPISLPRAEVAASRGQSPHDARQHRIIASPLARRLALAAGLDLGALSGSGPHGRIIKRDVDAALAQQTTQQASQQASQQARPAQTGTAMAARGAGLLTPAMPDDKILALYEKNSYELVPHDGMRKVIAQRLTLSKQTIPHFYLSVDCRIDELLAARQRLNAASPKDGPRAFRLTVNDFFIKALALALTQVPAANVTWTEAGTLRHKYCDIGVAVAVAGGLFTPIIRHAELKSLSEISNEMRDLAERARKRRLVPHEYQGGTTSISNLGMYGIKSFEAVINPPHATILAVGAGEKRPVVTGDQVAVATMMVATLSGDHRVVDGAVGAELLNAFKMLIEDPVRMLI
jgi:pyruvate dehydrogenase E2 component (dihydrolipoamide acetyltransferase)